MSYLFISPGVPREDPMDAIVDDIWDDDELLLEAVKAAQGSQTIDQAVGQFAVHLYETRKQEWHGN